MQTTLPGCYNSPLPAPRKSPMPLAILTLIALVVIPFLFWRGTWFGRPLTDPEIDQYLNDDARPRRIQHALAQISQRLERLDPAVERWYPRIAALARHPVTELRVTAAWLMGQDTRSPLFHQALPVMLADADPIVRRNAALSLARFADPAGRSELVAMLRPYALRAPRGGVLRYRLKAGEVVNPGTLLARLELARLETGDQQPFEIRSPLPGTFERQIAPEGARVSQDQEILSLTPSQDHVWEALRALYLVGAPEDLAAVERFTRPPADWDEKVGRQARLTAERLNTPSSRR